MSAESLLKIDTKAKEVKKLWRELNVAGQKVDKDKLSKLNADAVELKKGLDQLLKSDMKDLVKNFLSSIEGDSEGAVKAATNLNKIIEGFLEVQSIVEDVKELNDDIKDEEDWNKNWGKNSSVVELLDRVASSLEEQGFNKEAEELDVISNTLETSK